MQGVLGMGGVKWIKLDNDIFNNRKILQIESMPNGDSIIVIWMKLLCLAGNVNDNGFVYFTKDLPYTEEMLSVEFNRPITTVRLALVTFQKFGMIEIIDDMIYVSSWEKYQNTEGLEKIREQNRKRVAKHREKAKLMLEEKGKTSSSDTEKKDWLESSESYQKHFNALSEQCVLDATNTEKSCNVTSLQKSEKSMLGITNTENMVNISMLDATNTKQEKVQKSCNSDDKKTVETEEKPLKSTVTEELQKNCCNVTGNVTSNVTVTQCNALDIDIDIDNIKRNIYSNEYIERKNDFLSCVGEEKEEVKKPKPKKEKPVKHRYGEYQHVLLTDTEYQRLADKYGEEKRNDAIVFLDEYIEMKGYKANSHNLAIQRWVIDAMLEEKIKKEKLEKYGKKSYNGNKGQSLQDFAEMGMNWAND